PGLPHPLGQQRLAERVVDLVRAGVVEVLALQVDRTAGSFGQAPRQVQRRRAADVVAQQSAELGLEGWIGARLEPRLLELRQRRHQRLRHVLAAVRPEAMLDDAHTARSSSASAAASSSPASWTAIANLRSFPWSFTPGPDSTPLATSTANGRTAAIASPTFS